MCREMGQSLLRMTEIALLARTLKIGLEAVEPQLEMRECLIMKAEWIITIDKLPLITPGIIVSE